jgi:hypothetical protein
MTEAEFRKFQDWFSGYVRGYLTGDQEDRKNMLLKEKHTVLVCGNIAIMAGEEVLSPSDRLLARCVGLFHDVGRFPQYRQYRTFNDARSVNHGELGARVLSENGVLAGLEGNEREWILTAVRYHNSFSLAHVKDERALLFLKLIRDADKLDIWRVFIEFFAQPREERASAAGIGLPDTPGYSGELLPVILRSEIIPLSRVRNLNDYKLLQLSWIFGLYFRASFRLTRERRIIESLASYLPRDGLIEKALVHLKKFVEEKLG